MPDKFSSKLRIFLIISAACFLLIFFNPHGAFSPLRTVFYETTYPFQKVFSMLGRSLSETVFFFSSIGKMRDENAELIKENNRLASQVALLEGAKKENDILREQLELAPRDKFDLEPGFVIAQDPQGLGNWITIGKGSNDGLEIGMTVIVSNGILVGKIDEAGPNSSRVNLLTNPSSSVNAFDLETGAKGLIRGVYGLGIEMDMVSQSDVLNKGDTVITSGLGGGLPRGLLIGKIQEIKTSQDQLFQQAIVMPRVRYQDLDMVFVIKNNK